MESKFITIQGAKEHNLKNISLDIPRNKFTVITGLSGSGKSSLAFDTIYAEGQRRYVESLSAYARQFLEQLQKPNVEHIDGLSPTISIEQKTTSRNPRSTVATQTEIYDYLRLLFARIGTPHCPKCGKKIERQSAQEIVDQLLKLKTGAKITVLAPIIRGRKGEYRDIPGKVAKAGYSRLRADGKIYETQEKIHLDKYKTHNIETVVDRLTLSGNIKKRLTDSIETALSQGNGIVIVDFDGKFPETTYSEKYACVECGINIEEIEPRTFSFNSPYGACPSCNGLGTKMEIDPQLLIPDSGKSWVNAIAPAKKGKRGYLMYYRAVMREWSGLYKLDPYKPFHELAKETINTIFYGSEDIVWGKPFEGVIKYLERMFRETDSDWLKEEISQYMSISPCPACQGSRLKKESLAVTIENKNISDISQLSIKESKKFFAGLNLPEQKKIISREIIKEIIRRLDFCIDVGLDYLTLDRKSSTLSGGEAERIRLATQVGSGLVGVIYILDEPSIGLHQKDNEKLLSTLHSLRDIGNTLIVVEHDELTIRKSDHIIDLGPGAGEFGGSVVYSGDIQGLLKSKDSLTAKYFNGELSIPVPKIRREIKNTPQLKIVGASENNLKNITISIPLGTFTAVTGVSGSGKSTLVNEIIYKAIKHKLYNSKEKPGKHKDILGVQNIDKVIDVDQSPIGRTPRSNPATYTGAFNLIRDLFSQLPESKMRGYKAGRFSFNVKGGRCESCKGDGILKIEMHFLPDVYVECSQCKGRRFNQQTLEVHFKDKNIADILELSVLEALELFKNIPRITKILQTLNDVGLGYIKLGQSATTLSGGEAQRVKLSSELCKTSTGKTLYILDEPTTGLHFADIDNLLRVLQRLVDKGNTVIVIEHNMEVIKTADYIIDLGPEGGDKGGDIVFAGPVEEIIKNKSSHTGKYLKDVIKRNN
ncbi:MAG: excinuclease ABC subunit UvrA [Candidatus Omnitrophica bacterium]|nr:excinuclease ABC subunit UvrA [Candidatus Omnitrophota bacterium]